MWIFLIAILVFGFPPTAAGQDEFNRHPESKSPSIEPAANRLLFMSTTEVLPHGTWQYSNYYVGSSHLALGLAGPVQIGGSLTLFPLLTPIVAYSGGVKAKLWSPASSHPGLAVSVTYLRILIAAAYSPQFISCPPNQPCEVRDQSSPESARFWTLSAVASYRWRRFGYHVEFQRLLAIEKDEDNVWTMTLGMDVHLLNWVRVLAEASRGAADYRPAGSWVIGGAVRLLSRRGAFDLGGLGTHEDQSTYLWPFLSFSLLF